MRRILVAILLALVLAVPAWPQSTYVLEMPTIGARTQEIANSLAKMMLAKDFEAAQRLVHRGDARFFKKGTQVFLMDSGGVWAATCKVREKGDPEGWWVPDHIVKRQYGSP